MANESMLTKPMEYEVNGNEVKLSGNMVAQYLTRGNGKVSEQELVMFMQLCKFQKLNPFLNEAYLIKFGNQPAQIIVSKEAFMKRAEQHSQYSGLEAGIIVERKDDLVEIEGAVKLKNDVLIGGWAKVYRKDRERPISVKLSFSEFGKGQATWKDMPLNMIRKTAIVNALREAFPDNVGALYTEEESNAPGPTQVNPIEDVKQEIENNANQQVIDFEDTPEQEVSNIKPADKVEVAEEKEAKQEDLFDVRKPPLNPEF
ncbi:phage recombination protein Bet [Carnobacterium antarcticum]|uniref:Phage recombination protein Bet n=1 Tax=Carnobacterium antarcticum TaxID=2126436 RepID=A0ABW4NMP1_9LACT|nr:phage recombination protein Bet [Carnobacterium sp. CP1]ALV20728.1 some similarities to phage [Carnobacterium sp. CP1]